MSRGGDSTLRSARGRPHLAQDVRGVNSLPSFWARTQEMSNWWGVRWISCAGDRVTSPLLEIRRQVADLDNRLAGRRQPAECWREAGPGARRSPRAS